MAGRLAMCITLAILGHSTEVADGCGYGIYRHMGPRGLEVVLRDFDFVKAQLDSAGTTEEAEKLQAKLNWLEQTVDEVAGQRHATVSRLYWYTDLERAKAAAAEAGKPILSLRMLGKLTDEFSCANSRYFRTALYANQEISDILRERFVLHWQSVRPVPKVTIDFGDGRKLQRTVTGNSAHYLLTAEGMPLDALPGLYSPKEFLAWLDRTETLVKAYSAETDKVARDTLLRRFHRDRLNEIRLAWREDIQKVAPELLEYRYGYDAEHLDNDGLVFVDALDVAYRSMAKARPEVPILQAISESPQKTDRMVTDKLWQRLAKLHRSEATLDGQSIELIRRQQGSNPFAAGAIAVTKRVVEDPILRLVSSFQDSLALDTVRNEYLLHREVHNWFVRGEISDDFDALNERVYAELFLTPSSDPWLGLAPRGVYTALDESGFELAEAR